MMENKQFLSIDRIDGIRKELDEKIETKISYSFFLSILGISITAFLAIGSGIFGYAFSQINELRNKVENLANQTIIVETKLDDRKSIASNQTEEAKN